MIERPRYYEWLHSHKNKKSIKIITGMRRVGKTTLLEGFRDEVLLQNLAESSVIWVNRDTLRQQEIKNDGELCSYIIDVAGSGGVNYVFLDGIDDLEHFERVLSHLFSRDNIDLYVAARNTLFMGEEFRARIKSRCAILHVFPLSFKEYHDDLAKRSPDGKIPHDKEAVFRRYICCGGLPGVARLVGRRAVLEYLEGTFNTIILEDIAARKRRMGINDFMEVAHYMVSLAGEKTSVRGIADSLAVKDKKASPNTVREYLDALQRCDLLHKTERVDLTTGKHISTFERYYLGDLGMMFWATDRSTINDDFASMRSAIKNVIYLELRRRYARVDFGEMEPIKNVKVSKSDEKCSLFITSAFDGEQYFRYVENSSDDIVLQAEIGRMVKMKNLMPRTLLSLQTDGRANVMGIEHINLIDWLLE